MTELPLWSYGLPGWARSAWTELKGRLPQDEDWAVWFDWYEQRLRGGSPGEAYELVFASIPEEEWDKGPAAANAWIREHLPQRDEEQRTSGHQIDDEESLRAWLVEQSREIAVAIAGRAALRIAPLVVSAAHVDTKLIARLTSAVFRATALARADVQAGYATANTAANAYAANAADAAAAAYAASAVQRRRQRRRCIPRRCRCRPCRRGRGRGRGRQRCRRHRLASRSVGRRRGADYRGAGPRGLTALVRRLA